jgi:ABC-type multidrug transport system ATPase subunit
METPLAQGRHLLPALLGLRGVAAVAVLLFHLHHLAGLPLPPALGMVGTHFGLGVQLFFVLSGFSLCHSTFHTVGQVNWIRDYLLKRLFRIAPLFYFLLAVWVVFFWLRGVKIDLATLILNLSFTFNFVPGKHESIVAAGWTIGVEMIFYAVLPVLLATIRGLRAALAFLVAAALVSGAGLASLAGGGEALAGYASLSFVASLVVFAAGMAGIVWFGSRELAAGRLSLGTFLVFLAYLAQFYDPLQQISNVGTTVSNAGAGARRVLELLAQEPEPRPALHPIDLPPAAIRGRRLEFRSVSVAYQPGHPVLEGLNLVIEPGETVALVGSSGGGKTTLANLIPRFYHPQEGAILLDGINLEDLRLESLRGNLAMVSQDVVLFNDTVAANIAYGTRRDAKREDIVRAAEAAHAMAFINEMPNGLDTLIGENGVRLSGGQRQRIAIARALLADPRILILDEATSNLDTDSERAIQEALQSLMRGRTSFVIAHRLSTIMHADRIVVLKDGHIAEMGTHSELMERSGIYQQMVLVQTAPPAPPAAMPAAPVSRPSGHARHGAS